MAVELPQHRAADRGLARADLAGELHVALPLANAVEQMIERLAMLFGEKKKARIRRDVERRQRQSIVIQDTHQPLSNKRAVTANKKEQQTAPANNRLCLGARRHPQQLAYRRYQGFRFRRRANRDSQIILHLRPVEPAHKDFLGAQTLQPCLRRKSRRPGENEIRPARQNPETQLRQFAAQPFARGDDFFEIRPVIRQIVQRGFGGNLAQAVHIVTVANLVQRRDEVAMSDKIADPLEAQRIRLGKRPRHEHVRIFQRQLQRVFLREIHVSLVQHHHAALRPAKRVEFARRIPAPAGRVRRGHKRQRGAEIPDPAAFQFRHAWQTEIRFERHRISGRP